MSRGGLHLFLCGTDACRGGGVVARLLLASRLDWSIPLNALGCVYPAGGCMGHPLGCLRSRLLSCLAAPCYRVTPSPAATMLHGAILVLPMCLQKRDFRLPHAYSNCMFFVLPPPLSFFAGARRIMVVAFRLSGCHASLLVGGDYFDSDRAGSVSSTVSSHLCRARRSRGTTPVAGVC